MNANLAGNLTETAARNGAALAIKLDDVEINYGLLAEGTARVAGMLQARGVRPGDRVAVMLPNVPHFPLAYYGALRAGAIVVPMNVLLKGREVPTTWATRAPRCCSPGTASARRRTRAHRRPAPR